MHAVGLHSALAIKRQRMRRDEQRRARERRYSAQSGESGLTSPRASTGSLDHHGRHRKGTHGGARVAGQGVLDTKVVTSIGMLHIGVVFLVLGAFLLMSGLLPGDLAHWGTKATGGWWNELVAVGLFAILVGIFLIVLNRVIAKKEEDDLEEYVQRQLTRSRSGHRLERDVETGGLTTRHARRAKQMKQVSSDTCLEIKDNGKIDDAGIHAADRSQQRQSVGGPDGAVPGADHRGGDHQRPRRDLDHQQPQPGLAQRDPGAVAERAILEAERESAAGSPAALHLQNLNGRTEEGGGRGRGEG